jgi:glutamate/aspartate transport system substrate-binding protein
MKLTKNFALLIGIGAIAVSAHAAELTGTLKKIKDSGTITLGVRESSIPFNYSLGGVRQVGYSYDIMMRAVDAVKADLKMPNLQIREIPVTPQNRITKQVGFSDTIFIIGTRLMTKKGSGIKDFADLKGKNVVTTAGTTSERLLRKMNDEKNMGMNIISAKEHGQSFLTLESGRAVAFMMDDALLYGERAKARNPDDWVVVGAPQSREAYGCMMRRDDAPFKKVVDGAIVKTMKSGEINQLYHKWFQEPVPPKGLNLNFPLSEDMKNLFKNPNDKALD